MDTPEPNLAAADVALANAQFASDDPPSGVVSRAGRYVLGTKLGEGGTSSVFEAHDLRLGRIVAIKQLKTSASAPAAALVREAQALASVDHPAVVRVLSVKAEADPPFLVMERVRGRPLASILADGRLTVPRALAILRQIAGGIDALHSSGIVHGDIKPSNVIIDACDCAKLIDVGLSPFLGKMRPGDQLGTPSYMPPERALGISTPYPLLPRGDVYSFGVVCFLMLTSRLPFVAPSRSEILEAHAKRQPPLASAVAGLSPEFDPPLAAALSKRPEERPATCRDIVDALERASRGADLLGRRLRILVADDDSDQQRLLKTVLDVHLPGASISTCGSGHGVIESLRGFPLSVVLLDLTMPGPSGIALVRQVRDRSPSTAVVILTGAGSGTERAGARALGVRNFVVKPFEIDELLRAIRLAREDVESVELALSQQDAERAARSEVSRSERLEVPKVVELDARSRRDPRRE